MSESNTLTALKVSFPYAKPASAYEPTKIYLAPEYIFLENIYSSLVEITPKEPEIVGGIADKFEWKGDELHLTIRDSLKTVGGNPITVDDVIFSLKRLLVLSGNTHGNFRDLVCPNVEIKSVDQDCEGIRKNGNTLILKAGNKKSFLLPMLAAIDFAIIPKSSVDPKTLKIVNYQETSGPYYVATDSESGHIVLKSNPNHYHYSKDLAQTINLIPSDIKDPESSFKAYKEGKVDFITTIDKAKPEDVINFAKSEKKANLHLTMNIRSFVATFTERGLKDFSAEERIAIGKEIQKVFRESFKETSGYENSSQFFPSFGEGSLSKEDLKDVDDIYQNNSTDVKKQIVATVIRIGDVEKYKTIFKKSHLNLNVQEGSNVPDFSKYEKPEDMPHLFISGPDTAFMEDIGLISYTLSAGFFGMSKTEREKWLAHYMSIPEKEKRIDLLKQKHKESLSSGLLVPLMVSPYVAFARAPWKIGLSQYFANNQLWLIKRQ